MTRYDAILLIIVILMTGLLGYFGYREWTDPILFPGGNEAPVMEEESESISTIKPEFLENIPDIPDPVSTTQTSTEPSEDETSVDPEKLQSSVEEALTEQVGQLAALMENRLAASWDSARDQIAEQSQKLASADQIIEEALTSYQENTRQSMEGISETVNLITDMQGEVDSITDGLENSRTTWNQLFDEVSDIENQSDDRLAETNFTFQTYRVSGMETLSEIARSLETEYNLPESDLSFLLNRFNDIEYRYYDPGGRRPAYRVVANDTLRVPVPKTVGTIVKDYALPEKLRAQIDHINQAATANASLRKNLSLQVNKLKRLEANVQAIASMSDTLKRIDLNAEEPLPDDATLTPELQEAWQQFENAADDYRSAEGFEKEQLAREKLKQSITRLLKHYEDVQMEGSSTETNPLQYYLRFIEKYRPE